MTGSARWLLAWMALLCCTTAAAAPGQIVNTEWTPYTLGPVVQLGVGEWVAAIRSAPEGLWGQLGGNRVVHAPGDVWREVDPGVPLSDDIQLTTPKRMPDGTISFEVKGEGGRTYGLLLFHGGNARLLDIDALPRDEKYAPKSIVRDNDGGVRCEFLSERSFSEAEVIYEISAENPLFPLLPHADMDRREQYRFARDSAGRIWFHLNRRTNQVTSPITIIAPDDKDHHVPGPPDARWSRAVAVYDPDGRRLNPEHADPVSMARFLQREDGTFWVFLAGREIWEVNPETFEGTRVHTAPQDILSIFDLFEDRGRTYVVASEMLYRLENDGWLPLLPRRHWLGRRFSNDDGLWIGAFRRGGSPLAWLWLLPKDGSPAVPVDEQSGLTINSILNFAVTASGRGLVYDGRGGLSFLPEPTSISSAPPLRSAPEAGSIGQIPPDTQRHRPGSGWAFFDRGFVRSGTGSIYGFIIDRPDKLARWDGVSWTYLEVPPDFAGDDAERNHELDLNRNLWLFRKPDAKGGAVAARFFPDGERWETYADMRALLMEAAPGDLSIINDLDPGWRPFRHPDGHAAYLTEHELHAYLDGVWQTWPAAGIWDSVYEGQVSTEGGVLTVPRTFDRHAMVVITEDNEILLRRFPFTSSLYRHNGWRGLTAHDFGYGSISTYTLFHGWAAGERGVSPSLFETVRAGLGFGEPDRREPPPGRFGMPPDAWKVEDGRLYRVFGAGQTPVFPEDMVVPLPAGPKYATAQAGPGGFPVLDLENNQCLIVLDPLPERPQVLAEPVDGNFLHLSVSNLTEDAALYWRFHDPAMDSRPVHASQARGDTDVHDPWTRLEGAAGRLGPFEDGPCIVEVMTVDGSYRTSERYRMVIEIEADDASLERWARRLAAAWPEPVPEAEAALVSKGRQSLDVLERLAASLPGAEVPALRRMIRIINAEYHVPAPDPPVLLPEPRHPPAADEKILIAQGIGGAMDVEFYGTDGLTESFVNLHQDLDGWVWSAARPLRSRGRGGVQAWTGRRWFGRETPSRTAGQVHFDSERRIWTTGSEADDTVWVYSPLDEEPLGEGVWKKYRNLLVALDALGAPGLHFGAGPEGGDRGWFNLADMVMLSKDDLVFKTRQAVYARREGVWRRWTAEQLPDGPRAGRLRDWVCALDDEGRALLWRSDDILRRDHDGQWRAVTLAEAVTLPPWAMRTGYVSRWELRDGGLYREDFGISGLVVPQSALPPDCPPQISKVMESPCGTLFLKAGPLADLNAPALRIQYPLKRSETQVELTVSEQGQAVIRTGTDSAAARHTWRLVGGAWQPAAAGREIKLPFLPPGAYEIEVSAVNDVALADTSPPRFAFESRSTPETIGTMMDRLVGGDAEVRKEAAAFFLQTGPVTLPVLRAQLEDTPDANARWRIEALIQRLE